MRCPLLVHVAVHSESFRSPLAAQIDQAKNNQSTGAWAYPVNLKLILQAKDIVCLLGNCHVNSLCHCIASTPQSGPQFLARTMKQLSNRSSQLLPCTFLCGLLAVTNMASELAKSFFSPDHPNN